MSFWTMPLPGLMGAGHRNVADVFSTDLYTGNGSTQTITNGLNMVGKGGLVWTKSRSSGSWDHVLTDTSNGGDYWLRSNSSVSLTNDAGIRTFKPNGFETQFNDTNENGTTFVGWSFCRAPKFFDVVTYTGNGASGRQIAHGLGVTPGFIIVKKLSNTAHWAIWHRSQSGKMARFTTAAFTSDSAYFSLPNETHFIVNSDTDVNQNGQTYVAFLFAHDASKRGIVQCGNYIGNGSASGPTVSLGWWPQYILIKNATATGDWQILDATRGLSSGNDQILLANTAGAETSANLVTPNSSGFQVVSTASNVNSNAATYIYMAIRAEGV